MINLEQRSEEWFNERRKYKLTASEIGAAMGLSTFCSRNKLYLKKYQGFIEVHNDYARRILDHGIQHEDDAIDFVVHAANSHFHNEEYEKGEVSLYPLRDKLSRKICYTYAGTPDASLVRLSTKKEIAHIEVKCPASGKIYDLLSCYNPLLPLCHYVQIMCQMACSGMSITFYGVWTPTRTIVVQVDWDRKCWHFIKQHCDEWIKICDSGESPESISKTLRMKTSNKKNIIKVLESFQTHTNTYIAEYIKT